MVIEFVFGLILSVVVGYLIKHLSFSTAVKTWVLSIGRFVHLSGHPLLDDDQKFSMVGSQYRKVLFAFLHLLALIVLVLCAVLGCIFLVVKLADFVDFLAPMRVASGGGWNGLIPKFLFRWAFVVGTLLPVALVILFTSEEPPKSQKNKPAYSEMDKFFHYLFLGNSFWAKTAFWIERFIHRKSANAKPCTSVYVSGLARSGSTSLMQSLGQLPAFTSLTYREMPLIFMPRTWRRLRRKTGVPEIERPHRDGMKHDLETQEALEEPFWIHQIGSQYVKQESLISHEVSESVHNKYKQFRSLIAGDGVYLAKNNNHLLRADAIHRLDGESGWKTITIIPFRHPYAHAQSLMRQHENLSCQQREDSFVLDYMGFLGHFEFGLDQKNQLLDDAASFLPTGDSCTLEYWMEVWGAFYGAALRRFSVRNDFCFFCYESYLQQPDESIDRVCDFLGVSQQERAGLVVRKWKSGSMSCDAQVPFQLQNVYDRLCELSINQTGVSHG